MSAERDTYKGNAMIRLFAESDTEKKYGFAFGVKKAKMVLENLDEVRKFVEEEEGKKDAESSDS